MAFNAHDVGLRCKGGKAASGRYNPWLRALTAPAPLLRWPSLPMLFATPPAPCGPSSAPRRSGLHHTGQHCSEAVLSRQPWRQACTAQQRDAAMDCHGTCTSQYSHLASCSTCPAGQPLPPPSPARQRGTHLGRCRPRYRWPRAYPWGCGKSSAGCGSSGSRHGLSCSVAHLSASPGAGKAACDKPILLWQNTWLAGWPHNTTHPQHAPRAARSAWRCPAAPCSPAAQQRHRQKHHES